MSGSSSSSVICLFPVNSLILEVNILKIPPFYLVSSSSSSLNWISSSDSMKSIFISSESDPRNSSLAAWSFLSQSSSFSISVFFFEKSILWRSLSVILDFAPMKEGSLLGLEGPDLSFLSFLSFFFICPLLNFYFHASLMASASVI